MQYESSPDIYTLSLHDALPISNPHFTSRKLRVNLQLAAHRLDGFAQRAQENVGADRKSTRLNSSHANLVCRLLLEKKKFNTETCRLNFLGMNIITNEGRNKFNR